MSLKKIIQTVKENHSKLKEKTVKESPKINLGHSPVDDIKIKDVSKKGIEVKEGLFIDRAENIVSNKRAKTYRIEKNDTLKSISEKIYSTQNKWIMLHLKNIEKIPNPYSLTIGMILDIPLDNEVNNFYDKKKPNGNYIISENDDIKSISLKIFGSEKLAKKLIEWNFLKFTKDIFPGKEVRGLKYLDLERQIKNISTKYDIKSLDYKSVITDLIVKVSSRENVPAIVPLIISQRDFHWFNIQSDKSIEIINDNWLPLNINNQLYKESFPRLAMDIEFNVIFGINKLKELRVIHKNWPRAIISYSLERLPGAGKPEEQKIRVKEMEGIINPIIEKMQNITFSNEIKSKTKFQEKEFISYDLLYKELVDYKEFCLKKYL